MPVAQPPTKELRIHSYPLGLKEKAITVRFLERRHARKAAVGAVHEKNNLPRMYLEIKRLIGIHDIPKVREHATDIIEGTHTGLQETYDTIFAEFLLMQEELREDYSFMDKHGAELSYEELETYAKYLGELKGLMGDFRKYIDELIESIKNEEVKIGLLNIKEHEYQLKGAFALLRPFVEWFSIRSITKATFKLEKKVLGLEEGKSLRKGEVHELLKDRKILTRDMNEIVTKMCIYLLIMIRTAYEASNLIQNASAKGQWLLPESYKDFAIELGNLLNDEIDALKSLNTCRLQIEDMIKEVGLKVNKAMKLVRVEKKEEIRGLQPAFSR